MNSCKNCKYHILNRCHRYPPQVYRNETMGYVCSEFPEVRCFAICGEFKQKQEEKKEESEG
jgi:hypothetical protein